MATLDVPDFETARQQLLALLGNRAPDLGLSPVEFGGEFAGALAQIEQSIGESVGRAGSDAVPTSDSSDTGLNTWAVAIGLSNGDGGYGPRGATAASGATGQMTGQNGTVYPIGQAAQAPGGVRLVLRASVTIPGAPPLSGQVQGTWDVDATDPNSLGEKGNLTAGTVCTLISAPVGADATFVLISGMTVQAQDAETGPEELIRIQDKMQLPPNGGNCTDLNEWTADATDENGDPLTTITIVPYSYPNYYNIGSPMVCATLEGSGTARRPSLTLAGLIQDSINGSTTREGDRPNGTDVTVLPPYMPNERALQLRARCIASLAQYQFDWVRGATNLVVASFSIAGLPAWATNAGANAVLELNTDAPVSLKDAITQGNEPRVYVNTVDNITPAFTGPVIPEQASAVAFNQIAGPATQLGLKVTNPANWSSWISGGNEVYSGGPIVARVADNILAAIDARGPSRASGLADPARLWQYVFGPTQISTAAETTLDTDGVTLMVDRVRPGGATIAIGAGSTPGTDEVTASDNTVSGPELLYAGRILVTD